jgi:hypothetical protein
MGETRNAYNILIGKPEGKRPRGRSRCRWYDTGINLREVLVGTCGQDAYTAG